MASEKPLRCCWQQFKAGVWAYFEIWNCEENTKSLTIRKMQLDVFQSTNTFVGWLDIIARCPRQKQIMLVIYYIYIYMYGYVFNDVERNIVNFVIVFE